MNGAIAVVGMACEFPDARSPEQLWENVIAQRQAFRPLPAERLRLDDYPAADARLGLGAYAGQAAVLEGYVFDRERFRIAGSAYRTVDLSHWLALDCADRALRDAGFADGKGLPSATTGVLIGNTLTGDYSRAAALQLRWPYVRASLAQGFDAVGLSRADLQRVLPSVRSAFLAPLPELNAETLAGWLSNTIAGRICNYFDLKGGGYVIDGACASSLLAVANACTALAAGDIDVAIAGGVDVSIDPFELVGFARVGALAADEMRPYDRRASGFWPGEGCGLVVLMRADEADRERRPVYARLRGWGVSSDGHGGITRPEIDGQLHAIRRAYRRAGMTIDSIGLFEGHGTGTTTGDDVELRALTTALAEAKAGPGSAAIGSIKANIGHTKAAAGAAGLIKTVLALRTGVLPPATACEEPGPLLNGSSAVRTLRRAEPWPSDRPRRAALSAMGFGGINVHVVLEEQPAAAKPIATGVALDRPSGQDAEIVPFAATGPADLRDQLARIRRWLEAASRAELTDLAVDCQRRSPSGPLRAALVAKTPSELIRQCRELELVVSEDTFQLDFARGAFVGTTSDPVVGLLCSGQGSPTRQDGGAWAARFPEVRALYSKPAATAQESIVLASLAGLRVLRRCGIAGQLAIGHSLGELTALHWAGALEERALLHVVHERAAAMERWGGRDGAMAALSCGPDTARALLAGDQAVAACLNGPTQTVISGPRHAVERSVARAVAGGVAGRLLGVPQAFHSPLMSPAAAAFGALLARTPFAAPSKTVYSTVLGRRLTADDRLPTLLRDQLTAPVRLTDCLERAGAVHLWIEVGPGDILARLVREQHGQAAIAMDACGDSVAPWLHVVAAAHALGVPVAWDGVADGRFSRPIDLARARSFIPSPCGLPAAAAPAPPDREIEEIGGAEPAVPAPPNATPSDEPLAIARRLIAARTELPLEAIRPHHRLLSDLHLNSMTVGVLAADLAYALGRPSGSQGRRSADPTVEELAHAALAIGATPEPEDDLHGVAPWVRPFRVEFGLATPITPRRPRIGEPRDTTVFGDPNHPFGAAAVAALRRAGGGILVCLPPDPEVDALLPLVAAARQAAGEPNPLVFLVMHRNGGGRGVCRTLALEAPQHQVLLVQIAAAHPDPEAALLEEISNASGFGEVRLEADGTRSTPVIVPASCTPAEAPAPGPGDVVLVSGGAAGITAECAIALARTAGCKLGIVGRSPHSADKVRAFLERCRTLAIDARYEPADVQDRHGVARAVERLQRALGAVACVVHGAGVNEPCRLQALQDDLFRATVGTKVDGARHLLSAVDRASLRGFVAFGSVIAQTGLDGEAHYAAANELLGLLVERMSRELPECRCMAIDWSVWSGAGMGERLNRVDVLERQGVTSIGLDQGVELFLQLLSGAGCTHPIVAGRLGAFAPWPSRPLPLGRFLERPRVHVPHVEIVADSGISPATDPYLTDHRLNGAALLPAVVSLEAMAQAAQALLAAPGAAPVDPVDAVDAIEFGHVSFDHPITADGDRPVLVRTAALADEDRVAVVLRSGQTGFLIDHAVGHYLRRAASSPPAATFPAPRLDARPIGAAAFYDSILFHGPRFQSVRQYRTLHARHVVADLESSGSRPWFGAYLPQSLVLGDPGVRDGAIHSIQACIPDRRLVPTGVDSLWIRGGRRDRRVTVSAVERSQSGAVFVYDLVMTDTGGVCEVWLGLRLNAVAPLLPPDGWPIELLGPLLERMLPKGLEMRVLAAACADRPGAGRALIARLIDGRVTQRGDGRPEAAASHVSAAHAGGIGLAIAAADPIACDLEPIVPRPRRTWNRLLGDATRLLDGLGDERHVDAAATRLWCARECLRKLGHPSRASVTLRGRDGATEVFHAGDIEVVTRRVTVRTTGTDFIAALARRQAGALSRRRVAPTPAVTAIA